MQQAQRFLDYWIPQVKSDVLDRAWRSLELANVALVLGELQAAVDIDAARQSWARAEVLLAPYASSQDGAILTPLAKARYHLGNLESAQTLLSRIQRSSYRHPAYVDLAKKLRAVRGGNRSTEPLELKNEKS